MRIGDSKATNASSTAPGGNQAMGSLRSSSSDKRKEDAMTPMVDADEACALLSSATHQYLDVRMWEDFDKGHVAGARNVPYYLSVTPHGKEKNPHFVEQVAALYGKDDRFIVGCRSGVRSKLATADLLNAGFKNVTNLQGGYLSLLRSANQQHTASSSVNIIQAP
ncbi:thiosulfate sulfurtransferase 16, chloroplastic-like [Phragmites australis]|uniref:thiosulfate sulfurtransferase 16, chloroplastic-like n=1 Tax=Phragmites australis TaxID=29695 RepID=UPI002D79E5BB|nr:thiosulfate sulfurtransferase 16, chloroplastic-like [Phragmites australis]